MSQSNNNADHINIEDRFKFIDDLTILEIINLLSVGLSSYNVKAHVPSNVLQNNQIIDSKYLKTQENLNKINEWTRKQKMVINKKKTKNIIFNFTKKYQFSTQLELEGEKLETVTEAKLLGTIVSNDLKWDRNTDLIVRKANKRMELLRKISNFGANWEDLKNVYILFIRSLLEQSCTVWHSGLTLENSEDLERIQKCALKIILRENYKTYENALKLLDLDKLDERREYLCLQFAKKCIKNRKMKDLFPLKDKKHEMITRNQEIFEIKKANTKRLQNSPVIYMQKLLNLK